MKDEEIIHDIIIVGGGPGGISSAIYSSRAKLDVLVIDKDKGQGAMGGEHLISNFPGFPDPIKAEDLLESMRKQSQNLGTVLVQDKIVYTDFRSEIKVVASPKNQYKARSVIIASGSMGRKPSIDGEADFAGRGVAYCAICDGAYFDGKEVAVTGQVDRVLEEIDMISKYASKIHFISPTGKFSDKDMKRLTSIDKVVPLQDRRIRSIFGGMKMEGLKLSGPGGEEILGVDGIFVYLQGNRPGVDYIADKIEKDEGGCIKVDKDQSSSIPGIFAVGDVTCRDVRQISLAVGEGCKAALSADAYLKGKKKASSQWGA